MRVFGHSTDSQSEWTAPYPKRSGIKLRLMGGDMLQPEIKSGTPRPGREKETRNYFNTIPTTIVRAVYARARKPFVSVRIGRFGFYAGHKVFGVDSEAYKDFPLVLASDVYDGSQALSGFTWRFTTNLK